METKDKISIPDRVKHFLVKENDEDLFKDVQEYTNYANYSLALDTQSRSVLGVLKDIPTMVEDPILSSAVKYVMQNSFQTDNKDKLFTVNTAYSTIKAELDKFHEDINADNFILLTGYNDLLWGQLPWKHCFNKDGILERVIPIPDFTSVTPIIVSGRTIGFMDEKGDFVPSYMYTYSQLQFYRNLGGNTLNMSMTLSNKDDAEAMEFKNEFCYANSYLGSVSKAWRNINIIEDALLLNRMDQSNYYRIISVNVGGQVYSKSAVNVLNYYRNLFKKVRRVSYDSAGMSSKGTGQNFEVIVPQSANQGVDIKNVGGEVDVRALKDLDTQYQRLFAGLQLQPSVIGFSDDVGSSLGDSAELVKDKRTAKLCKTVSYSAFSALKNIDYLHLRSLGYNVDLNDWSYGTVSQTIQEDSDKGETLKLAVDNLGTIVEKLNLMNTEYDKVYLTKSLLGGALSSFGVDVEQLMSPKDELAAPKDGPTVLGASLTRDKGKSFRKSILNADAHAMALAGIYSESESKQIVSALESDDVKMQEKISPMTLKQLCSSVAVKKETPINFSEIFNKLDSTSEEIVNRFDKASVEQGVGVEFQFPIFCSKEIEVTAGDLETNTSRCIKNLYIDKLGNQYLTSKADVVAYLSNYMNSALDNYVENVWRNK